MSEEKNWTPDRKDENRERIVPGRATSLDGKKLAQDWLSDIWDPGNDPSDGGAVPETASLPAEEAESRPEEAVSRLEEAAETQDAAKRTPARRSVEEPSYEKERLLRSMNRARESQRRIVRETGARERGSDVADPNKGRSRGAEPIDLAAERKARKSTGKKKSAGQSSRQKQRKPKLSRRQRLRLMKRRLLLCALTTLALGIIFLVTLKVEQVTVAGNSYYSEEEVVSAVFTDGIHVNPIGVLVQELRSDHRPIPYIQNYRIRWTGIHTMEIRVEEKAMAGYIDRMGTLLYFDSTGRITESTQELRTDVPRVEGLSAENLVLGEQILGVRDEVFTELTDISRYLNRNSIRWGEQESTLMGILDCITFDPAHNATLVFGQLSVSLGSDTYLEEKLQEMRDILPELESRRGILYLDGYDPVSGDQLFLFKDPEAVVETKPAETNAEETAESGEPKETAWAESSSEESVSSP